MMKPEVQYIFNPTKCRKMENVWQHRSDIINSLIIITQHFGLVSPQ